MLIRSGVLWDIYFMNGIVSLRFPRLYCRQEPALCPLESSLDIDSGTCHPQGRIRSHKPFQSVRGSSSRSSFHTSTWPLWFWDFLLSPLDCSFNVPQSPYCNCELSHFILLPRVAERNLLNSRPWQRV